MSKEKIFSGINTWILATILILITIINIFKCKNIFSDDINIGITFVVIAVLVIFKIITNRYTYSLDSIQWIFMYLFCFYAPMIQVADRQLPWNLYAEKNQILYANILIIIWIIVYSFAYKNFKIKIKKKKDRKLNNYNIEIILNCISSISMFFLIYKIGFNNMFSRGQQLINLVESSAKANNLIITIFVRSIPIACFVIIYLLNRKREKKRKLQIFIAGCIVFITNFPTGTARFWTGTVYIGIAIIIFDKIFSKFKILEYIIFIGMIVIFPILNIFRTIKLSEFDISILKNMDFMDRKIFYNGDFDAYSMFIRTIDYVKLFGSTNLYSILGVILFFIPRSIWNSKPISSGELVAMGQGLEYTNLANPIFSEAYLNGGIVFLVILACLMGIMLGSIDKNYWDNKNKMNFIQLIYPFLIGHVFFNYRGAMMSSYAYMIGQVIAFYIIYIIAIKANKINIST